MKTSAFDPHFVYRVFDSDDALMYVGCTANPHRRFAEHRTRADWFEFAVRVDWEPHPDRRTARLAERKAIRSEAPECNVLESTTEWAVARRRRYDLTGIFNAFFGEAS